MSKSLVEVLEPLKPVFRDYRPPRAEVEALCAAAIEDRDALDLLMAILGSQMGEAFTEWQINDIFDFIGQDVYRVKFANRGASKSRDGALACCILCIGEPRTRGLWLAGNASQLDVAIGYLTRLKEDTCLGACFSIKRNPVTNTLQAYYKNGSRMGYNACTQTSGPRVNLLVSDEAGKIKEKTKIEKLMHARGTMNSAKGKRRFRAFTTPSIGTPAEDLFFEFSGTPYVTFRYPEDCYWWTEDDWAIYEHEKATKPSWWFNCEYRNILDAPGGKILCRLRDLWRFDLPVEPEPENLRPGLKIVLEDGREKIIEDHWVLRQGTDWNPSWGHTISTALWDGEDFLVIDEWRGLDVDEMARYLLKWQQDDYWRHRVYYVAEKQGNLKATQSRSPDLVARGVIVHRDENFTTSIQLSKLTTLEGLNEHGHFHIANHCKETISQGRSYRRDERTQRPAERQEDHFMDSILHALDTNRVEIIVNNGGFF